MVPAKDRSPCGCGQCASRRLAANAAKHEPMQFDQVYGLASPPPLVDGPPDLTAEEIEFEAHWIRIAANPCYYESP